MGKYACMQIARVLFWHMNVFGFIDVFSTWEAWFGFVF